MAKGIIVPTCMLGELYTISKVSGNSGFSEREAHSVCVMDKSFWIEVTLRSEDNIMLPFG